MYTLKPNLTAENKKKLLEKREKVYFNSNFNFLNQHNGIRPGSLHLLMAPTHAGKTTLTHSIIHTTLKENKFAKILLYLTEEKIEDFETAAASFFSNIDNFDERMRIMIEDPSEDEDDLMDYVEDAIESYEPDILFFDNITTSKTYQDKSTQEQSRVATWLKGLTKIKVNSNNFAVFVVAHSNGNSYNTEILTENHLRGSKTIGNLAEFFYALQPVKLNETLFQFLLMIKNRGQQPLNKIFLLDYNKQKRSISKDQPKSFDEFKEVFKLRNKL